MNLIIKKSHLFLFASFCFSQFYDSNLLCFSFKRGMFFIFVNLYKKWHTYFWLTSSPRLNRHSDDESPVLGSTGRNYKVLTFSKRSPTNNCKRIHFLSLHIFQLDLLLTLTCSTLRGLLQPTLRSSWKNAH